MLTLRRKNFCFHNQPNAKSKGEELGLQNQMLESLVTQGYNAFLVFPGDPAGTVAIADELAARDAHGERCVDGRRQRGREVPVVLW